MTTAAAARIHVLAALLGCAAGACASGDLGNGDRADAAASVNAPPGAPDSAAGQPDASENSPDAASGDPDAAPGPDATVTPDGPCSMGWVELLDNADFEMGHAVWTEDTGGGADIIAQQGAGLPFAPHAGSWGARILGYNNADNTLSQAVSVPPSATELRLRGYQCYVTSETSVTAVDVMSIELRDGATLLQELESSSNLTVGDVRDWTLFDYTVDSAHAGQTITLAFDGVANASYPTSFVIDTLALEAYACQ